MNKNAPKAYAVYAKAEKAMVRAYKACEKAYKAFEKKGTEEARVACKVADRNYREACAAVRAANAMVK